MIKRFRFNDEKGFTLTELIGSIFLIGLLGYGFTLAMLQFVIGYQETRDYLYLQQQMLNVFDKIRHGHVIDGINHDQPLIGLLTAQQVSFNYERNSIEKIPVDGDTGFSARHWVRVFHNPITGHIHITGQYGFQVIQGTPRIFPSNDERIGREFKFQITELRFEDLTEHLETPQLVNIRMTGRVRFRAQGARQRPEEDLRRNVRYVQFENTVYIGNADKQQ